MLDFATMRTTPRSDPRAGPLWCAACGTSWFAEPQLELRATDETVVRGEAKPEPLTRERVERLRRAASQPGRPAAAKFRAQQAERMRKDGSRAAAAAWTATGYVGRLLPPAWWFSARTSPNCGPVRPAPSPWHYRWRLAGIRRSIRASAPSASPEQALRYGLGGPVRSQPRTSLWLAQRHRPRSLALLIAFAVFLIFAKDAPNRPAPKPISAYFTC